MKRMVKASTDIPMDIQNDIMDAIEAWCKGEKPSKIYPNLKIVALNYITDLVDQADYGESRFSKEEEDYIFSHKSDLSKFAESYADSIINKLNEAAQKVLESL